MARRFTSTNLVIAESKPNITNSTTKNDCKSTTIENDGKIIVVLEIIAMSNVKIITNGQITCTTETSSDNDGKVTAHDNNGKATATTEITNDSNGKITSTTGNSNDKSGYN